MSIYYYYYTSCCVYSINRYFLVVDICLNEVFMTGDRTQHSHVVEGGGSSIFLPEIHVVGDGAPQVM